MSAVATRLCLTIALLAQPVTAQMLYKSTMPDGRVIYGDQPAPGASKVEKTKPDTSSKGITPTTAREGAAIKQMEADRNIRDANAERVREAELSLRDAEAKLAAGKEPLAGERIGTATGANRLTDAYWDRQKALEGAVEQAKRNLEQARASQ